MDGEQTLFWQRLSAHLWRFSDTCNVHALVHEGEAALIDSGSGAVLEYLGEIGVGRVQIPGGYEFRYPRVAIAADVTFNGRYLGRITEATLELA